jgi:cytochrome c oxidase cbb3-type subunit 4
MSLDMNTARIAVTVISFAAFMAILWYVASPRNRARFDEASQLPFREGDER